MEKEKLVENFKDYTDKKFSSLCPYFDFELKCLNEMGVRIFEINRCLMINANNAAITLTNHTLERLLKISLVENYTIEQGHNTITDTDYKTPHELYSGKTLGNTIELARKADLITEIEKAYLFDTVREQIRNGFSHSDSDKILVGNNTEATFFQTSFSDPTNLTPVILDIKHSPLMQNIQMEEFSKENAVPYFDKIFKLILSIDGILWDRFQKSSVKN